ncbi:DUF1992 domain-containing protein [Georgenia soli]|nr:DUF1992 domain-containing protein [Georgenia soli]
MTERKPADLPVGNWVDQLIRAAQERGEFDDLPGAGKPLRGVDAPLDEDWWVRQKIRDEGLPADALLPPALLLRKEVAELPEVVRDLPTEDAVREAVRDVNLRVAAWIRTPTGPVIPVAPADPEAVVAAWRAARGPAGGEELASPAQDRATAEPRTEPHGDRGSGPVTAHGDLGPPRPSWWQRLLRRRPRTASTD